MGGCFSIGWLEAVCIYIVCAVAVFYILQAVLPILLSWIGIPLVVTIIRIVLWAVFAIIAIKIIFMLLSCLLGGGFFRY